MIAKERIKLLPLWCITNKFPAFYDTDSATAVEQTAKIYGAMRELQEDYNKFVTEINSTIIEFIETGNADQECFKKEITKIMHNYIRKIDEKIKFQDLEIASAIEHMKNNLSTGISNLLTEMKENGELNDLILEAISSVETAVSELNSKVLTNIDRITVNTNDIATNRENIATNTNNIANNTSDIETLKNDVSDLKNSKPYYVYETETETIKLFNIEVS